VFIGDRQAGWFTNWYVFHDPFTFVIFWVYFTCATASVNRAPFDLAEAESELVAGFHTEYSGLRWSFFFMAEYGSMLAVSLLASILFLGGWHGPIPIGEPIARAATSALGWIVEGLFKGSMNHSAWTILFANVLGTLNVITKGVVGVTVMMWIRWTLPRLRIDQVISVCLKYCVPIAAVMFLCATTWQYYLPNRTFFGLTEAPENISQLVEVRAHGESKPAEAEKPAAATSSQPVLGGDRTALVDNSRTK
jgi:NADH-quinone oxidoreductase subunit H